MENEAITDVVESTVENTAQSVGRFQQFLNDSLPGLFSLGINIILALVVFFVGHKMIGWIRRLVRRSMEKTDADKGVGQFIDSLLKFGLHVLLVVVIAGCLGVESTSIAAAVASCGVAVGLALQGSLSNLAGGILILLLKPFVVGDYIIEDTHKNEGTVKEIQIFYTKLSSADNKTIVIPNGTLANSSLTNVTDKDYRRLDLRVDISYEADLKKAKALLEQILSDEAQIDPNQESIVFVDSLGESSVLMGMRAWVKTEEYWNTRWRLLETVKLTLDENGIEIPYKQMTVHLEGGNQS